MTNEPTNNSHEYRSTGYLIVKVTTAKGFIPIENAKITITGSDEENADYLYVTESNAVGSTEKIELPAANESLSLDSSIAQPYARYAIKVEKEGYFTHLDVNVTIFSNITSIQPVYMIPTSMFRPEENRPSEILLTTKTEQAL